MDRADAPLIVTALLDAAGFGELDALRRRHFPPRLNRVPAHISLFHHLPGRSRDEIEADVEAECADRAPSTLMPLKLRSLGRGVAIAYEDGRLTDLRAALARRWSDWLTPQDRQPFKAHVTIQNKADAGDARRLMAALGETMLPVCRVEGVLLWRYLDGPWERVATCRFGETLSRA